jgi:hypothetical protein
VPCGIFVEVALKNGSAPDSKWYEYYQHLSTIVNAMSQVCVSLADLDEIPSICTEKLPSPPSDEGVVIKSGAFEATLLNSTTVTVTVPDSAFIEPYVW